MKTTQRVIVDRNEALLRSEAKKHDSDPIYGSPLALGKISIAFHAANCSRCAKLARKAAVSSGRSTGIVAGKKELEL